MYHPVLDTFLAVVESGSFTKAAEKLYISPTAVMKQMNAFEQQLQLKLIDRSPSGIQLTPAGAVIYTHAQAMIRESKVAIAEARAASYDYDTTFCVGSSLLFPANPFMDAWYTVREHFPDHRLHLVSFDDTPGGLTSEIEKLGEKYDFLVGPCDETRALAHCSFLPLGEYPLELALSRGHRLARKKELTLEDLHGETLLLMPRGSSSSSDALRKHLKTAHPEIHLEEAPHGYDLSLFNSCAETERVLPTFSCWADIHPGIVTLPVHWDVRIPYGIFYAQDAPEDIQHFITIISRRNA